jgi:regulator of sigma E protease
MTIIIFLLMLSVLILIHELGHFVMARRSGIRVEEFGLGLPPKLFGKKIGDTVYSINALPFGGFVKLTGEDSGEEGADGVSSESGTRYPLQSEFTDIKEEKITVVETEAGQVVTDTVTEEVTERQFDPFSYAVKSPWQRIKVLLAGVFMNVVLAVSLFYIFFSINGFQTYQIPLFFDFKFPFGTVKELNTVVGSIEKGKAAETAGIQLGEAVLSIDGVKVNNAKELRAQLVGKTDKEVEVKLMDLKNFNDYTERTLKMKPSLDEEGNPILGVYLSKSAVIFYTKPLDKLFAGFLHSYNVLTYSFSSFGKIIGMSIKARDLTPVSQSVAGPVGIYNIVDTIVKYGGRKVFLTIMDYMALMSLSLAAINVLPFPALDGGRAAFVLVEVIRKKKINAEVEAKIHKAGMIALLVLLVVITLKDILLK